MPLICPDNLVTKNGWPLLVSCIILSSASLIFKFIPNRLYADILSTLNFFCGITSLFLTYNNHFALAVLVIILGQLFDLFDGRMAEIHGGTKYGPYLDDIADFVSFGLSPAYIIIKSGGSFAWLFALIFFICPVPSILPGVSKVHFIVALDSALLSKCETHQSILS